MALREPLANFTLRPRRTRAGEALAAEADLIVGVGTRYSDFATASRTAFAPDARFVNLNIGAADAHKLSAVTLVADARTGLVELTAALGDWAAPPEHTARAESLARAWDDVVTTAYAVAQPVEGGFTQTQVLGAVNEATEPADVVVCAAGSMPGDLHRLWRTRDRKGYHVEYGYSCMGYEVAGGLGVGLAVRDLAEDRVPLVLVGDGSWLMLSSELVTAIAEEVGLVVVLVHNHGYASIGALSESVGAQRFGTRFRAADGGPLPVDLAANAASLGATVVCPLTAHRRGADRDRPRGPSRRARGAVHRDPRGDRPDGPRAGQSGLVGRARGRGLRACLRARRAGRLRGSQGRSTAPSEAERSEPVRRGGTGWSFRGGTRLGMIGGQARRAGTDLAELPSPLETERRNQT